MVLGMPQWVSRSLGNTGQAPPLMSLVDWYIGFLLLPNKLPCLEIMPVYKLSSWVGSSGRGDLGSSPGSPQAKSRCL